VCAVVWSVVRGDVPEIRRIRSIASVVHANGQERGLAASGIKIGAMSGHSKWATTKHQKAVVDARRAKSFAKLIKNIEVAARIGGGDVNGNPTLYDAIQKARKTSVPKDNIDRAVKRGSGAEGEGSNYETLMYEAYGPAGIALLIECLTDNRNRSASEVRIAVTRNGGTMADAGSTARMFSRKGVVTVAKEQEGRELTEDDILEATIDADPDEVNDLGDMFEIISDPANTVQVRTAVQQAGLDYESAEVSFVPEFTQEVDESTAEKLMKIIDALEDSDDVQNVYANFDAPDEVLASLG
jgi:YebC/PmpR family DNA-binding regulatory protein